MFEGCYKSMFIYCIDQVKKCFEEGCTLVKWHEYKGLRKHLTFTRTYDTSKQRYRIEFHCFIRSKEDGPIEYHLRNRSYEELLNEVFISDFYPKHPPGK